MPNKITVFQLPAAIIRHELPVILGSKGKTISKLFFRWVVVLNGGCITFNLKVAANHIAYENSDSEQVQFNRMHKKLKIEKFYV